MKNSVIANVSFSFKGEIFNLSMPVDLDAFMEEEENISNLYPQMAESNGIGLYSYEYEMMMAEPIMFSAAEGIAADYLIDGVFDLESFQTAWRQARVMHLLGMIAESEMGIGDLEAHPELKRALTEAYLCGKESG
ncbi:MAG: hypothetical protein RPU52_12740 [Candidatus Sedimenticola sp. (ex Thyasira tokunagai)]